MNIDSSSLTFFKQIIFKGFIEKKKICLIVVIKRNKLMWAWFTFMTEAVVVTALMEHGGRYETLLSLSKRAPNSHDRPHLK